MNGPRKAKQEEDSTSDDDNDSNYDANADAEYEAIKDTCDDILTKIGGGGDD